MFSYFLTPYVTLMLTAGGMCSPEEQPQVVAEDTGYSLAVIYADPGVIRVLEPVKTVNNVENKDESQVFIIQK